MATLKSIFHRAKRAEEAPSSSAWPPAPSGVCDICSRPVPDPGSARVPGGEFKDLVRLGYNPFASGRVGEAARALYAGASEEEAYASWKGLILEDTTDWALCGGCAADLKAFAGHGSGESLADRQAFLEEKCGRDLAAKLIGHLGVAGAAALVETALAEAQARFARFRDLDSLSEEEHKEMRRKALESGTATIQTMALFQQEFMAQTVLSEDDSQELLQKADEQGDPDEKIRFIYRFVAEKIAGYVASDAIKNAGLPEDRDLYLDLGARIYLDLVPMRMA